MRLSNAKVAGISLAVFTAMLGLGFAAKPLYGTFCRVTGYGGTTRIATSAPKEIVDQTITVRFDTNVADVPLEFRPLQRSEDVKIGQHGLAGDQVLQHLHARGLIVEDGGVVVVAHHLLHVLD